MESPWRGHGIYLYASGQVNGEGRPPGSRVHARGSRILRATGERYLSPPHDHETISLRVSQNPLSGEAGPPPPGPSPAGGKEPPGAAFIVHEIAICVCKSSVVQISCSDPPGFFSRQMVLRSVLIPRSRRWPDQAFWPLPLRETPTFLPVRPKSCKNAPSLSRKNCAPLV